MDKETEILNGELSIVATTLVLLIILYYYIEGTIVQQKLNNQLYQAKETTVYYYTRSDSMENSVISLNKYIEYLEATIAQNDIVDAETAKLKRIISELRLDTQKKTK